MEIQQAHQNNQLPATTLQETLAEQHQRINEIISILKSVGLVQGATLSDEGYMILACEINKDYPGVSMKLISDTLFAGAKGHLNRQSGYIQFNMSTIFGWLESRIHNSNKPKQIVI